MNYEQLTQEELTVLDELGLLEDEFLYLLD